MVRKNQSILVTGGAGYIGSHVVEQLVKKKLKIIILDNLVTGFKKLINKKAKFIKGDIKNIKTVNKILKTYDVDTIVHLAASLNVSEAEKFKEKYFKNNILGTENLIKACKNTNVKNIIFSSSCSIYGNIKGAVSENNKPNPMCYYAYTKYKGENIIKKNSEKYNYKYAILRYFNVAGASSSNKIGEIENSHGHLFKNLAIQSQKKNPLVNIYGSDYKTKDGTCIRDYIHVSDLADIHIKSIGVLKKKNKSLVLNCGYGKGFSVKDIVNIFKKIRKSCLIRYKDRRPGDIAQVYANTKKFKRILKWKPKYNNVKKILQSAINWEKKLKNNKNKSQY
jgi:UDP-glucose 4-epimerase